jgi:hypothetical protein
MDLFNSREIAALIWGGVALVFVLSKATVRQSVLKLFRVFLHPKILLSFGLMAVYVGSTVAALSVVGTWKPFLLKDTVSWFCFTGIGVLFGAVTSDNRENVFRKTVTDSVKIVILVEFLVNTYTFPLACEMMIVPVAGVLAMIDAIAHTDEKKYAPLGRLAAGALSLVGLIVLAFAAFKAISDYHSLRSADALRSLLLAPVLSILFLPFVYLMLVFTKYELIFTRLSFGPGGKTLNRYAKCKIMLHCRLSLRRVKACLSHHAVDLMHIQSKSDIDGLLATMKARDSQRHREG